MHEMHSKWRLIPAFTVRCSSLSVRNLLVFDDETLFVAIDNFLKIHGEFAKTAKSILAQFSQYELALGGDGYRKVAKFAFSPPWLIRDRHYVDSFKKLLKLSGMRDDGQLSTLSITLDRLIEMDRQATVLVSESYSKLQNRLETVAGQEKFCTSLHSHPFRLGNCSTLRAAPLSILRERSLETDHKLSLLKLILRMIGRNDSTRALGKLVSGRIGNSRTVTVNLGQDEHYYLLLDRNFVQRVLLRLRFAGAQLGLQVNSVPHSVEFFRVVAVALSREYQGDVFFENLSGQFSRSYELALKCEVGSDLQTRKLSFESLLVELVKIDSELAAHLVFPYALHAAIGRILAETLFKRAHSSRARHGVSRRGGWHNFQLFLFELMWNHFGTAEVWLKLTEDSLAAWLFGLSWLSGYVEISREVAQDIEDALNLSLNLIESFSELAASRFVGLSRSGVGFYEAFEGAVSYALEHAGVQGAQNAQAAYNVSDVMLSGTTQDLENGNYEVVISDLNVRGTFLQRPDELYLGKEQDTISGRLTEHLAAFFDEQEYIDWVYGGLAPSGILQLVAHSMKNALTLHRKSLRVKSIRSLAETVRSSLMVVTYPRACRFSTAGKQKPRGLWFLLDEEYRAPENLFAGMNSGLQTVRFYDAFFFLHALAMRDEILDRLLSKIVHEAYPRVRVRLPHCTLVIDEILACFKPIHRAMTPEHLVQSLAMVRALKSRHNLDSCVYVKGLGKPVLISLDSMACILVLKNLLTEWKRKGLGTIKISNMDPPPDKLWLHDTDGPHTAELRVVMTRQR